ncbi:hypothetical protein GGI12_003431 [Dipsacomyces acuminosporus]|nr:hypothetical protein GGI12_003431 [Dipsacomyces acuminosporus]
MEPQQTPLLTYAAELLQSYSRLIVYSGDILRSLPEPREGLSVANIKPKKEESIAFGREWQHLESVFDEYLIRLNDIRARAREELQAARIKYLIGEDIDLTLPEAAEKLSRRLAEYKKQYGMLQMVLNGGSIAEQDLAVATEAAEDTTVNATAEASDGEGEDEDEDVEMETIEDNIPPAAGAVSGTNGDIDLEVVSASPADADDASMDPTDNSNDYVEGTANKINEAPTIDVDSEVIDIEEDDDGNGGGGDAAPVEVDSSSDVDNDEDMEKIFQ